MRSSPQPSGSTSPWQLAVNPPLLGPDDVHVWRTSLDPGDAAVAGLWAVLNKNERQRAERLIVVAARRQFIVARGTLRHLLGGYLGCDPAAVVFRYQVAGKPFVDPLEGRHLHFNVSHSGSLALFAFAWDRELGVDVERAADRSTPLEQLAARYFSASEQAALQALPVAARQTAFFACWTRKEAFLKATGAGLTRPLDSFDVALDLAAAALLATRPDAAEMSRWSLCDLAPGEGYAGALAAEGQGWRLWRGEWRPPP